MGLDVYVGALTRYYSGQWETVVQSNAREQGYEVQIVRSANEEDDVTDPQEIGKIVHDWQQALKDRLSPHVEAEVSWAENMELGYFTDKPSWKCYGDLLLWAAHTERPDLEPLGGKVADWTRDPAYLACNAEGYRSRFSHLLRDVEIWLPIDFDFTFRASDPSDTEVGFGSAYALRRQLHLLNEETWNGGSTELDAWRRTGPEADAPCEEGARFAFAVFIELVERAIEHHLPMRLDY